jgi:hypothetical protein
MAPAQVAQKVLQNLARAPVEDARVVDEKDAVGLVPSAPEILSMDLVDGMNLGSVLGADSGYPEFPGKNVWVVRTRGRFASKASEGSIGHYYVDDDSGEILGFGARGAIPAKK